MRNRWKYMSTGEKALFAVRMIGSVGVIVFASLQLLGIWDQAMHLTAPLMGIVLLVQSIQEWKQHRGVALFGLGAALFLFVCAIVVWFVK